MHIYIRVFDRYFIQNFDYYFILELSSENNTKIKLKTTS